MENQVDLSKTVARLESKVDLLETELHYLDKLLLRCGFPEGIKTLKATVEELLAEDEGMESLEQERHSPFEGL